MITITYRYQGNTQERTITLRSEQEEKRWRQSFRSFVKILKREVGICLKSTGDSGSASETNAKNVEQL